MERVKSAWGDLASFGLGDRKGNELATNEFSQSCSENF